MPFEDDLFHSCSSQPAISSPSDSTFQFYLFVILIVLGLLYFIVWTINIFLVFELAHIFWLLNSGTPEDEEESVISTTGGLAGSDDPGSRLVLEANGSGDMLVEEDMSQGQVLRQEDGTPSVEQEINLCEEGSKSRIQSHYISLQDSAVVRETEMLGTRCILKREPVVNFSRKLKALRNSESLPDPQSEVRAKEKCLRHMSYACLESESVSCVPAQWHAPPTIPQRTSSRRPQFGSRENNDRTLSSAHETGTSSRKSVQSIV